MHILFPGDYFKPSKPDEMFLPQAKAFADLGISHSTLNLEMLNSRSKITPALSDSTLYRGWMLSIEDYESLTSAVLNNGGIPYTTAEDYRRLHYLPNWYSLIADLTPETIVLPVDCDLETELRHIGWEAYFIKDYVKSLKTSVGSIISDVAQVPRFVDEMKKFRGKIEGGYCVRRVEDFLPETEVRYFVVNGTGHSPLEGDAIPDIAAECAGRIGSKFFSVDVILTKAGKERIVEVGDGQVSDIVGWEPARFAKIVVENG